MDVQNLKIRSLKAKMTLSTLAIFLVCMWTLSFYASRMLRFDMERISGQQQFSTVSLIADQINDELNDRMRVLAGLAGHVTPAMLAKTATLQTLLEERPLLQFFFNGGVFVTGADGTAIADVPLSAGRIGVNYMDRASVFTPLREGKTIVGGPSMGRKLGTPVFSISAPIQDANGKLLGAVVGIINLGLPNFLDTLTQSHYGLSGGYLLVAREPRLIVTASDKRRIMQRVASTTMADRYIGGYEGSDVFVSGIGVEVLASVKGIPVANWFLAASLPTTEAFAPIHDMQQRMLWATVVLSVVACALTWWLLRRQLFPILVTVERLAAMADTNVPLLPLPVPEDTEVGELVGGVNRVLKTLELRETALKESDVFRSAIIDSVFAEIAVLDCNGVITIVNKPWQDFARQNELAPGSSARQTYVGSNYLKVCKAAIGAAADDYAVQALQGIQAVLDRNLPVFTMEYPCDGPDEQRWFSMLVTPLELSGGGAVVAHHDITERRRAVAQLLAAKAEAEIANNAKSHFLAAVSHDLRQPLAALMLYLDLLNTDTPGNTAKLLPRIRGCAANLGGLLSDLLDLSKLQAGAVVPAPSSFPMRGVLDSLPSVQGAQAAHKGLRLRVRPTSLTVQTDRTMLLRIVGNLVTNAVQYTSSGGVLIACRRRAGKHWLEVYDTGIGIAEDKIGFIFGEFRQLGNEARNAGSGLGLYIVAKTAELLGLRIRVRSRVGCGSMFAIELPSAAAIVPAYPPAGLLSGIKLRVAVVEDNLAVLQALTLTLEQLGHEVVAANTGRDVIARLDGQAPDLIITDYRLAAGETGYDVIEDARAIFGEALPAIIITGDTDKDQLRGMTEQRIVVMYKPVPMDALRAAMVQVTGKGASRG